MVVTMSAYLAPRSNRFASRIEGSRSPHASRTTSGAKPWHRASSALALTQPDVVRPATITVGRPLVSCPRAGVLDAVVVLRLRAGVARSLAFRLLYDAGTWRATEAALVGATAPPDATAHP